MQSMSSPQHLDSNDSLGAFIPTVGKSSNVSSNVRSVKCVKSHEAPRICGLDRSRNRFPLWSLLSPAARPFGRVDRTLI